MRRAISITIALLFLAVSQGVCQQEHKDSSDEKSLNTRPLSPTDKRAVVQAIVDEMYVNNLQGYGFDVGKQNSDSTYELTAYFKPTLRSDRVGWIIHKLMPYGEVLRLFSLRDDGVAVLYGKLRDRFPPTQPSYLTVYMDDEELCQSKKNWSREHFTVELKPSADRIAEARTRQEKRE